LDGVIVLAALASAALHAAWNAAVRSSPDAAEGYGALVIAAGVVGALAIPFTGVPALEAWPWMAAATTLNAVAMRLIAAAYVRTGFALAYPIARGFYPPLLLLAGVAMFGEWPSAGGIAGLALVSAAILALVALAREGGRRGSVGALFALGGAAVTAAYVACDVAALRVSGSVWAYAATISAVNGVVFGAFLMVEGKRPLASFARRPAFAFGWSVASMASYLLVLYGFAHAPAALVAAVRETSVLFATAYAALLMGERLRPIHWLASGLATAGVVMIRLG
jgi:drug/metabolite transporter (DMT)-like permease